MVMKHDVMRRTGRLIFFFFLSLKRFVEVVCKLLPTLCA